MFKLPAVEGAFCIGTAIAAYLLGHIYQVPELTSLGGVLAGIGIGYLGGNAISVARNGNKESQP